MLFSCGKEEIDLPWTELNSPISTRFNSVVFTNSGEGHIVGGDVWTYGVHLFTENEGQTWIVDTFATKMLFNLDYQEETDKNFAVGIGGFYQKNTSDAAWFTRGLNVTDTFPPFNDVAIQNNGQGILVGGGGFGNGVIVQLGDNFEVKSIHKFENEISAVCYSNPSKIHAFGFGIVLLSTDSGTTWTRQDVNSDFYRAVHFPNAQIGYAVGSFGSIIKTTDGGLSWKKIRDGDKRHVSNEPFRSVFFTNEDHGYIVGEGGLFWQTQDGGTHWKQVKDFPNVDLYDIYVKENKGFIVGANGRIFEFIH